MRLHMVVAVVALALANSCGGSDGAKSDGGEPDAGTSPASAENVADQRALVGEWERVTTCAELVEALKEAGMDELVDEFVAGNGFIPGVGAEDPEQIDPEQPCKGAVPRVHSHFFTADGEFGSRDWNGEDVDDGRYRVMDDKLVISKEFPDVTFRYRVEGDTVTFDPLNIPAGCTTFRCGWSIAVAYPGKKWTRVS
jgi:hypothetical protein